MNQQDPGFAVLHLEPGRPSDQIETELIKTIVALSAVAIQNISNLTDVKVGRDRLVAILNAIDEGIILVDVEGQILLTNQQLSNFSGLKEDDLLEATIFELMDPELGQIGFNRTEINLLMTGLKNLQLPASPKTIFEVKDSQRTLIIERNTLPFWDHDGKISGLLIVLRDITEEREIEETREAITETIVHDVRSPLSAIIGSLELLTSELSEKEGRIVHQAILVAQRSANRILSLTEALLDIARLESGQMNLLLTDINLKSLISELMIEFTILANENNVIIQNQIEDEFYNTMADKDKLIRVITNLVDNAIKFSPQGGLVKISVDGEHENVLMVKIADSGPGVPPDYQEKIFDRFVQVPGQKSRRRGTGLGLTFCKLVVEAHGGEIWVEPNLLGGSTFIFSLPITNSNIRQQL
jgi:PAS domain S-box-containing protein